MIESFVKKPSGGSIWEVVQHLSDDWEAVGRFEPEAGVPRMLELIIRPSHEPGPRFSPTARMLRQVSIGEMERAMMRGGGTSIEHLRSVRLEREL